MKEGMRSPVWTRPLTRPMTPAAATAASAGQPARIVAVHVVVGQEHDRHGRHRDRAFDRQVDAADEDHEREPHRQRQRHGGRVCDADEVAGLEEARVGQRDQDAERYEHEERRSGPQQSRAPCRRGESGARSREHPRHEGRADASLFEVMSRSGTVEGTSSRTRGLPLFSSTGSAPRSGPKRRSSRSRAGCRRWS